MPIARLMRQMLLVALASGAALAVQAQSTIVIVRHAEKPPLGLGQLDCRGLNRALALPSVLLGRWGRPTAIYAPNPADLKDDKGVSYAYVRPLATIEPTAIRAGLPVQLGWGMTQVDALANELLAHPGRVQLVAWEHHWAVALARTLMQRAGGQPSQVPDWDDEDFDSIYVLQIGPAAGQAAFTREREGLNGLPESCP